MDKSHYLLAALTASVLLVLAGRLPAQTFTTMHTFTAAPGPYYTNSDGANPVAGLVLSGNTLYGTARYGSSGGDGTIFRIELPVSPPRLTITPAAAGVILTWPTNATGFARQSTTHLLSPAWAANSSAPVIVNAQNTVTNPISGTRQSCRLAQ